LKNSQKDVVIKVLKPGIEDTLVADLNFIYVVARVLEFLSPELERTSLVRDLLVIVPHARIPLTFIAYKYVIKQGFFFCFKIANMQPE
jgi:hypothetical protein